MNTHMFCSQCGNGVDPKSTFCQSCGTPLGVAASPLAQAAAPVSEYLPATAGKRFANLILDSIFSYIWVIILVTAASTSGSTAFTFFFSIFGGILYFLFFEALWQRTPAKFITGTKVVMPDGSVPPFGNILGRSFARCIPFEAFSFLFDKHPRGWHDSLSNTLVVPVAYTEEDVRKIPPAHSSGSNVVIIVFVVIATIAIVGILASVVLASLGTARLKARDAKRVADVLQLRLGLELFFDANGSYPQSLPTVASEGYIQDIPTDPATFEMYPYYRCAEDTYHLAATLETESSALEKDDDQPPMCESDMIDGRDRGSCDGTDASKFCYDVTS